MNKMSAGVFAFSLLVATPVLATNIVINPGFEAGANDFNGQVDNWANTGWGLGLLGVPPTARTGIGAAARNGPAEDLFNNSISQTLGTVAGQTYDFSFWVAETSLSPNELVINWDGRAVATILNPTNDTVCSFDSPTSTYTCGWIQLVVPNLTATSDFTLLQIFGRQDQGYIMLDDFVVDNSVATESAVPEPASMMLLGSGLAALVARYRKRSTARARLIITLPLGR